MPCLGKSNSPSPAFHHNFYVAMTSNSRSRARRLNFLPWKVFALLYSLAAGDSAIAFDVIRDGQPKAVIVTPDRANEVVLYAAQELVFHCEKATGVKLSVVTESGLKPGSLGYIYLGATKAAKVAEIEVRSLAAETFILRCRKDALYIVGQDDSGAPLDRDTSAGTLFGVYEWLERDLGVHWLWPGALGTHVPKVKSISAKEIDLKIAPHFLQRHVRSGLGFTSEHPALGFTAKAAESYAKEQTVFLRRHRMGRSEKMSYSHAFTDWWQQYGKQHPEWFQFYRDKRGPAKRDARYSMCVSNPELQSEIIRRWKSKGGAEKAGTSYINAVENDILGLCSCQKCQALDGPAPADAMKYYSTKSKVAGSRFVSDRYAHFWLSLQELAAQENAKTVVIGYVYFNYFQAPTSDVKLNSNILLGFCPSGGWYPRSIDEHGWYKQQWTGWRDTGARLFSRTNYFLDGYCMPFVFAHQFADEFKSQNRQGMVATDFDSLTGQWSTQGPSLYLLMRLHQQPEADADQLLQEYYAAFGPAAGLIRDYFDSWEKYTLDHREKTNQNFERLDASRWRTWAKAAHLIYPEECFKSREQLLQRARTAAALDSEALARIEFLRMGLDHAKLASKTAALLTLADPESTPERGAVALQTLLRFRRANEEQGFANLNHSAWVESLSWTLSKETKQAPDLYP